MQTGCIRNKQSHILNTALWLLAWDVSHGWEMVYQVKIIVHGTDSDSINQKQFLREDKMAQAQKEVIEDDVNMDNFRSLLYESVYSDKGAAKSIGVHISTVRKWAKEEQPPQPNKGSRKKVLKFMINLKDPKNKRIKKHSSYGYVTQEQWDKLKSLGIGPDRDVLLKQIDAQNKSKGKTK